MNCAVAIFCDAIVAYAKFGFAKRIEDNSNEMSSAKSNIQTFPCDATVKNSQEKFSGKTTTSSVASQRRTKILSTLIFSQRKRAKLLSSSDLQNHD